MTLGWNLLARVAISLAILIHVAVLPDRAATAADLKNKRALNLEFTGDVSKYAQVELNPPGLYCYYVLTNLIFPEEVCVENARFFAQDATVYYDRHTVVSISPVVTKPELYRFNSWSGHCSGTGECQVTLSKNRTVGAEFENYAVELSVSIVGEGTVTSVPAGISCEPDCSGYYDANEAVTLKAVPARDWRFVRYTKTRLEENQCPFLDCFPPYFIRTDSYCEDQPVCQVAPTLGYNAIFELLDSDLDGISDRLDPDDDNDGMPDDFETAYGLNPLDPDDAAQDLDGDGLANLGEFEWGSDPSRPDTDGDGTGDGDEVALGRDPLANEPVAIMTIIRAILGGEP